MFDRALQQAVATFSAHNGPVNKVIYHPSADIVFSASNDNTCRIWPLEGIFKLYIAPTFFCILGGAGATVKAHNNHVTGISLHATGQYILSTSRDKSWAFSDIGTG